MRPSKVTDTPQVEGHNRASVSSLINIIPGSLRAMIVFAVSVLFMIALVCSPVVLRAQSGRKKTIQTTGEVGSTPSLPSAEPAKDADAQSGTPQGETVEGDVVRVNTTLVTVPVSVRDRAGRYAPDLARGDFHIFEDGVEQQIAYFAAVDQPFTVALVIDTSGSTNFRLEDIQDAAIAFVNQLKPADRVLVVSFDEDIRVQAEPTSDRAALTKAIRRTRTGGGTRLYDAVNFIIRERLRKIEGRKAVVLFTDGVDTTSRRASYESTLRDAEELDALIYPVSYNTSRGGTRGGGPMQLPLPGGRGGIILGLPFPRGGTNGPGGGSSGGGPTASDYRRADAYLRGLANVTGGRLYNGDSVLGLSQAFAWVAEELRRQYSLGYYPKSAGQAGQRRKLKVSVSRPELVVLARDSYIYSPQKPAITQPDGRQFSKAEPEVNRLTRVRP
ncbi:MAG TPA: VWA domain-containing protein [Pyrinomonadaceae bacterium]